MPVFKFSQTVKYTEVAEVEADSLEAAKAMLDDIEFVRNNDDTVLEQHLVSRS